MAKRKSIKKASSQKSNSKIPTFLTIKRDAVICPYCKEQILPAEEDIPEEGAEEAYQPCDHVVLAYWWGLDSELDEEFQSWWDSTDKLREKLEDAGEDPETIFRKCPLIDHLIEHTSGGGISSLFIVSFGFRVSP